jgi:ABC-2 type transport system permease protein
MARAVELSRLTKAFGELSDPIRRRAVVMAVFAVIGVVIGALVRDQIAAVVAVLVWMLAVWHIVVPSDPTAGRWMPAASGYVLMPLGQAVDPDGKLPSASASGLPLTGHAALAVTVALRLTPEGDVC